MSSFKRKIIRITIILDPKSGSFADKQANQLITQGLRTSCNIIFGNGQIMPTANIRIWGLAKDDMNKLTSIKWNVEGVQNNTVKIDSGDDPNDLSTEYIGNISFAYPDYSGAPDVCLCIESNMALYHQLNATVPNSFKGEADVATILESLAKKMGIGFENNGVTAKINNQYLPSTAYEQFKRLVEISNIELYEEAGRFIICNKGQPRQNKTAIVTPSSGLIGYPVPNNIGASFVCLNDINIRAGYAVIIRDSIIEQCNGTWRVTGIDKNLEAEVPDGQWHMNVNVAQIGDAGNAPKTTK